MPEFEVLNLSIIRPQATALDHFFIKTQRAWEPVEPLQSGLVRLWKEQCKRSKSLFNEAIWKKGPKLLSFAIPQAMYEELIYL